MSVISSGKNLNMQWAKITDLKTRTNILLFLQSNHITDIGVACRLGGKNQLRVLRSFKEIKRQTAELETLTEHLTQYDNYKNNKAVIRLFENAKQYFTTL